MKKLKLVDNVSEVLWLHWSTKAMAAVVAMQGLWVGTPDDWKKGFPIWLPDALGYATVGLGMLSIGFKLIKQKLPSDTK